MESSPLVATDGIVCVQCRSERLTLLGRTMTCQDCGTSYPVVGGVALMFEDATLRPGHRPDAATAEQILRAFALPADPIAIQRVRQILGQRASFGGGLIATESRQFLERVRNSGHEVNPDFEPFVRAPTSVAADGVARPRWLKSYLPWRMPRGTELLANVRFENAGSATMLHDGPGRTMVSAQWHDEAGRAAPTSDVRTPLPIDLPPGQALTLPVRLHTPSAAGPYTLSLVLVEEDRRWLDADKLCRPVEVGDQPVDPLPPGWNIRDTGFADYDEDHRQGLSLLQSWLQRHAPPQPRILEVGGNAVPMIEKLSGRLYNVDVDLVGLQFCQLRQRWAGGNITSVCADAANLPFPPNHFDVIVLFATLHHFPDPAKLLAGLRSRLAPDGFIGIFCEPVGHSWPGAALPEYRSELEKGVNEQSFSPAEYVGIFRSAELVTEEAIVDLNSLKARLVRQRSDRAPA